MLWQAVSVRRRRQSACLYVACALAVSYASIGLAQRGPLLNRPPTDWRRFADLTAETAGPAPASPEGDVRPPSTTMGEVSLELSVLEDLSRGRYDAAARQLATAPDNGRFAYLRARLEHIRGRYASAVMQAQRVVMTGDRHPALGYALWVQALIAQGQLTEAKVLLSRAMGRGTSPAARTWEEKHGLLRLRFLRAQLAAEQGRSRAARRDYRYIYSMAMPSQAEAARAGAVEHWAGMVGIRAQAAVALDHVDQGYELFSTALQAHDDLALMVAWADAMLLHDHRGLAYRLLTLTLMQNPSYPPALLLRATLEFRFAADPDAALMDLEMVSKVNPRLSSAWVLRGEIALHAREMGDAERAYQRAIALRPGDLHALALRAAQLYAQGEADALTEVEREVLAQNPAFVELFMAQARVAEWLHRYEDQVALARRALELAPHHGPALTLLGMNLLRIGQEAEGRRALQQARLYEPHNRRVQRVLALYDDVIDREYVAIDAAPFVIRMSRKSLPVLEPYAGPLLQRGYAQMTRRYGVAPAGPLQVELYDSEHDFAVRTTGLPRVGVQGVCFGTVITAISPRAASYNWGQILWHELSHVFHLQLSAHRVPRWFTEGLAEYETSTARTEWRREEERTLFRAMWQGRLSPLSQLERAFNQADEPDALMVAYYTSTLAVSYLVQRVGFDGIVGMLRGWGRGEDTATVLLSATGDSLAELDRGFFAYLGQRFGLLAREFAVEPTSADAITELARERRARPDSAPIAARLAFALVANGKYAQGAAQAHHALALEASQPLAHFALSRVALQRGDTQEAAARLRTIVQSGLDSPLLRRMLAHAAKADGRAEEALAQVRAAIALDTDDLEAYRLLLELSVELADRDLLVMALTAITRLDQHDRMAYRLLMTELARRGWHRELVRVGEAAIYVDPASPTLHRYLAEGYAALGQDAAALQEYRQLARLRPRNAERAKFGQAHALMRMGRLAEAKSVLADVLRLKKDAESEQAPALSPDLLQLPRFPGIED